MVHISLKLTLIVVRIKILFTISVHLSWLKFPYSYLFNVVCHSQTKPRDIYLIIIKFILTIFIIFKFTPTGIFAIIFISLYVKHLLIYIKFFSEFFNIHYFQFFSINIFSESFFSLSLINFLLLLVFPLIYLIYYLYLKLISLLLFTYLFYIFHFYFFNYLLILISILTIPNFLAIFKLSDIYFWDLATYRFAIIWIILLSSIIRLIWVKVSLFTKPILFPFEKFSVIYTFLSK